jgi:hypothetical protein
LRIVRGRVSGMKAGLVAVAVVVLMVAGRTQNSSETRSGTIVVIPISDKAPQLGSPGCFYNPKTLKLSVDKRDSILWPHKDKVRIPDLELDRKHLVVLTSDGKRLQSFWFRFSDYQEPTLCLLYDAYGCAQLSDTHTYSWCKVK